MGWQQQLTENYGCPQFMNDSEPVFESKAFCWCGMDNSPAATAASLHSLSPVSEDEIVDAASSRRSLLGRRRKGPKSCHNKADIKALRHRGKHGVEIDTWMCGDKSDGDVNKSTKCMQEREHLSAPCALCYGKSIACTYQSCQQECACSPAPPHNSKECQKCVKKHCKDSLHRCSGIPIGD